MVHADRAARRATELSSSSCHNCGFSAGVYAGDSLWRSESGSYIMKRSSDDLLKRLRKTPVSDVCVSVITKSELLYGVEISPRRQQDEAALNAFLACVEVLDFASGAASHYASIPFQLKVEGTMIGANDRFIAAHARSLGVTLVANDTREFARVPELKTENWTGAK